jgi:hypothetical protein
MMYRYHAVASVLLPQLIARFPPPVGRRAADDERSRRNADDGSIFHRVSQAALPALRVVPDPRVAQFACAESIGWVLSVDNRLFRVYVSAEAKPAGECRRLSPTFAGKSWWGMTQEVRRARP